MRGETTKYVLSALEDRFAGEQLGENAPDAPHVNRRALQTISNPAQNQTQWTHIIGKAQHDLGRTVPPRRNILRHEALVRGVLGSALAVPRRAVPARKAKVADLELAVGVDEEVARLEVAVEHVRGVDVLEATERLVDE